MTKQPSSLSATMLLTSVFLRLLVPCAAFSAVSRRIFAPSSICQDAPASTVMVSNTKLGSTTNLKLFATNSNSGDSPDPKNDSKGSSRKKSNKIDSDSNKEVEDVENFSAFLNRMGHWPLVETLEDKQASSSKEGKEGTILSSASTRNPFLSPFASLLNFEEVIQANEGEILGSNTLDAGNTKDVKDVMDIWGNFVTTLKKSFGDSGNQTFPTSATAVSATANATASIADELLKTATNRVESVLSVASTAVSPDVFSSVIKQARTVLKFQDDLVAVASSAARDRGLDGVEAAERARNATDYVASLVAVADQVLRFGYVKKEDDAAIGNRQKRKEKANEILQDSVAATSSPGTPLFHTILSARAITFSEFGLAISTIAEMGWLSGGIYENGLERSFELGHSIVARGISADVYWMITDSTENEADFRENPDDKKPGKDIPVRTIIIRGFDASDERVDREQLFTEICNLKSQPFDEVPELLVHRGMYQLADAVYKDVQKYIDWSAPAQKIIFTGHSVGGSISILVTLMLARDRGGRSGRF